MRGRKYLKADGDRSGSAARQLSFRFALLLLRFLRQDLHTLVCSPVFLAIALHSDLLRDLATIKAGYVRFLGTAGGQFFEMRTGTVDRVQIYQKGQRDKNLSLS